MLSGNVFCLGDSELLLSELDNLENKVRTFNSQNKTAKLRICVQSDATKKLCLEIIAAYPNRQTLEETAKCVVDLLESSNIYSLDASSLSQQLLQRQARLTVAATSPHVESINLSTMSFDNIVQRHSNDSYTDAVFYVSRNDINLMSTYKGDTVTIMFDSQTYDEPHCYYHPESKALYKPNIIEEACELIDTEQLLSLCEYQNYTVEHSNRIDTVMLFHTATENSSLSTNDKTVIQALHSLLYSYNQDPQTRWYNSMRCYYIKGKLSLPDLERVLACSIGNLLFISADPAVSYLAKPEYAALLSAYSHSVQLVFLHPTGDTTNSTFKLIATQMGLDSDELFEIGSELYTTKGVDTKHTESLLRLQDDNPENVTKFLESYPKQVENKQSLTGNFHKFLRQKHQYELLSQYVTADPDRRLSLGLALEHSNYNQNADSKFDYLTDWIQKLEKLVGLKTVKAELQNIINRATVLHMRNVDHLNSGMVLTFEGNPGCGKTTAAELFAYVLKSKGCLTSNSPFHDVRCQDLIGQHVGEAARNVDNIFNRYSGSVIFIDEAYELLNDYDYGKTVLSQLAKNISHINDSTVVILAGYPEEMSRLLKLNPGIESRITKRILFDDYTEKEILGILDNELFEHYQYQPLSKRTLDAVHRKVRCLMKLLCSSDKPNGRLLGNGRFAVNLANRISMAQSARVLNGENGSPDTLNLSDVDKAVSELRQEYYETGIVSGCVTPPYLGITSTDDTLASIIGNSTAKERLSNVIDIIKNPQRYEAMGAKLPRGVLLTGPAGCGKTSLARAVAHEASCAFIAITGSQFIQEYSGQGATELRNIFLTATQFSKCIIFIDEIDAIGKRREDFSHDALGNQALMQLLTCIDGFRRNKQLFILAATNQVELLDSALIRPGRFDYVIPVQLPTVVEREEILKLYLGEFGENVDVNKIARLTTGASGAMLQTVVNTAKIAAARDDQPLSTQLLLSAVTDQMVGYNSNLILTPEAKYRIAVHEIGHAILSLALFPDHKPELITVIPKSSGALGYTWNSLPESSVVKTKTYLLDDIKVLLGGCAAETLLLGDMSTGSHDDLSRATQIVSDITRQFGMGTSCGLFSPKGTISDTLEYKIEEEAKNQLTECYNGAVKILTQHRHLLEELTKKLFENEIILGEELNLKEGI